MRHFVLKIERVPEHGELRAGETFEVASEVVTLGRISSAMVCLSG